MTTAKISTRLTLALALAFGAFAAQAQDANTTRCQTLATNVQATLSNRVAAAAPSQDPSAFNQNNYDINGILSQDVTAGFSKLMSLDFSSIMNSLLQAGLQSVMKKATASFNAGINATLNKYGAQSISMGGANFGISVNTSGVTNALANTATNVVNTTAGAVAATTTATVNNAVNNAVNAATPNPYSSPITNNP
jgi:hypothetical protein